MLLVWGYKLWFKTSSEKSFRNCIKEQIDFSISGMRGSEGERAISSSGNTQSRRGGVRRYSRSQCRLLSFLFFSFFLINSPTLSSFVCFLTFQLVTRTGLSTPSAYTVMMYAPYHEAGTQNARRILFLEQVDGSSLCSDLSHVLFPVHVNTSSLHVRFKIT